MARTLGSEALRKAPGTQREKAAKCRVDESTMSRWCNGRTTPTDYQTRKIIQAKIGIDPDLFDQPLRT